MPIFCENGENYRATIPGTEITAGPKWLLEINTEWYGHFLGAIVSVLLDDDCYWNGSEEDILTVQNQIMQFLGGLKLGSGMPLWTVYFSGAISAAIPAGHEIANGLMYPRSQYPEAYDLASPIYLDTVNELIITPQVVGRVIRGLDTTYPVGTSAGSDTHPLTVNEMPAHTHTEITAVSTIINGGLEAPANAAIPSSGVTGSTGGGVAHNNMQRFHSMRPRVVLK